MATNRHAVPDDVPGIAEVIEEAFGDQIDQPYCRKLIEQTKLHVWVAVEHDEVVGVIAGFSTTVQGVVRRWEIDLLAVRNAYQGKRIGKTLIDASWKDARQYKVNFARALVRLDNIPAQQSFKSAGYATNGQVYDMIFWTAKASTAPPPKASLVTATPVDTLTYRGLWLEGLHIPLISDETRRDSIAGARAAAARENRTYVSTLAPADNPLAPDVLGDGQIKAQFQWWRKP